MSHSWRLKNQFHRPTIQQLCDELDNIITVLFLNEEKKLARKPNHFAWSPLYKQHRKAVNIQRRLLRSHRRKRFTYIHQNKYPSFLQTLQQLETAYRTARNNLRQVEQRATEHQQNYRKL